MKQSRLARRMILHVLVITGACVLVSVVYYRSWDFLPFLLGAVLGGAVSIGKILLLERAVDKALGMEKASAGKYVSLQHLLRLGLSAAALLLGALIPQINLWGVVAGVLAFQISVYLIKWMPGNTGKPA